MTAPFSLLIIDDETPYRQVLTRELSQKFRVRGAGSAEEGLQLQEQDPADVIILDLKMKGMGGIEFLHTIRQQGYDTEVIIMTGFPSLDTAVDAVRNGAYDYLTKPADLDHLELLIGRAGEKNRLTQENLALRRALTPRPPSAKLQSEAESMQPLLKQLPKIAKTDLTVLINGETGTGKEVVAREIHRLSPRHDQPLVVIDCASLQGSVRGSELFGHERGAFTGANQSRPGLFEAGDKGTVFLDEIAELDPDSQAALLRVLENAEIRRIGATKSRTIDVRVVAATHKNLEQEVANGQFRSDLLYRLQVAQLEIPPLRERTADLPGLLESFQGTPPLEFAADALDALSKYAWPGNIRELRNVVEVLTVTAEGEGVEMTDLPPRIANRPTLANPDSPATQTKLDRLRDVEREHILGVYKLCGHNKRKAADTLGISLRSLYNKLAEFKEA